MARVIGIDLGTTNSVMAVMSEGGPDVLPNIDGERSTRSMASVRKRKGQEETLIGSVALDNWEIAPADTIVSAKRLLGRGVADDEVKKMKAWAQYEIIQPSNGTQNAVAVKMGGKEYSPAEISALVLGKLKKDAETRLNEEVKLAVITVPAYFGNAQKAATREAARRAGLRVIKLLDEPTAAAIAAGVDVEGGGHKIVLVYDLGGGTFDISVLMVTNGVFVPLAVVGDLWLGGEDFDKLIIDRVVAEVKKEEGIDPTSSRRFMVALQIKAQKAKERLSSSRSTNVVVTGLLTAKDGGLIDVESEITREWFEDRAAQLVQKTLGLVEKALTDAQVTKDDINHVVLAGNASTMPMVHAALEATFGRSKLVRSIHPKEAVALGAVTVASWIPTGEVICQSPSPEDHKRECGQRNPADALECRRCKAPLDEPLPVATGEGTQGGTVRLPEIAEQNYGLQRKGDQFAIFVRKGEGVPTAQPRVQTFQTALNDQRILRVPVLRGESSTASANEKQGEAFVSLPPGQPERSDVKIKMWLKSPGQWGLEAYLDDMRPLMCRVLQGGPDERAIDTLLAVEHLMLHQASKLSSERREKIEEGRARALLAFERGQFDEAVGAAKELQALLDLGGDVTKKARNLIGFSEMLSRWRFAFPPGSYEEIEAASREVERCLEQDDGRLPEAVKRLDEATNDLPRFIRLALTVVRVVVSIQDKHQELSEKIVAALRDVETETKRNGEPSAETFNRLFSLLEEARPHVPADAGAAEADAASTPTCSKGHQLPDRNCHACMEVWGLQ